MFRTLLKTSKTVLSYIFACLFLGIAVAGTGIGTFVFAPLTEYLIFTYTWRGATLIIGGIMFNITAAGAIFRPLTSPKIEKERHKFNKSKTKKRPSSPASKRAHKHAETEAFLNTTNTANGGGGAAVASANRDLDELMYQPVTQSLIHFPTFMRQEFDARSMEAVSRAGRQGATLRQVLLEHGLLDKFYCHQSIHDVSATAVAAGDDVTATAAKPQPPALLSPDRDVTDLKFSSSVDDTRPSVLASENCLHVALTPKRKISKNVRSDFDQLLPLHRKDIFYRGSLMRQRPLTLTNGRAVSCPNIAMTCEQESVSDLFKPNSICNCLQISREARHTFRRMLHVSIFRSKVFLYFCLSTFMLYLAYDVPYVFTPDAAVDNGVSESKASFLLSLIGITSTVGQVVLGWVGDFPRVNAIHLYNVITSIAGACACLRMCVRFAQ